MYYETVEHVIIQVQSAQEAAARIKSGQVRDFDALQWTAPNGHLICVVADNHCNNTWAEIAVINMTTNRQIESITAAWCNQTKLAEMLEKVHESTIDMGPADLPIYGEANDQPATFECGCCGEYFESTIAKQKKFDQDSGYGICPDCCGYFCGSE